MGLGPDPNTYPLGVKDPDYLLQLKDQQEHPERWVIHSATGRGPAAETLKTPLPSPSQPRVGAEAEALKPVGRLARKAKE